MSTPEAKQQKKEYDKKRYARPEIKERNTKRINEPEMKKRIKERQKRYSKEYRNRPEIKERQKKYHLEYRNTPGVKKKMKESSKKSSKKFYSKAKNRLSNRLSKAIGKSLKGNKNGNHWEDLVGYTLNSLIKHFKKLFRPGMTWENYGEWHIDHIIPISIFNFTRPEHRDFKRCWALKNLQPLWAKENLEKHNKTDKHFQPSLLL